MTAPLWTTPAGFLGTLTERRTTATNFVATGTDVSYSVVSGSLPTGLYLNTSTGQVLGTPVSVPTVVNSTFVLRAKNNDGVRDRTFSYDVEGPDAPVWVTLSGRLPVGINGEYYTINKEYVDYTLRAETDILSSGNTLKYYLVDNLGDLPPGLKLASDGRITGYVSDQLDIAVTAQVNGGYDTESYDFFPFEHGAIDQKLVDENLYLKSYNVRLITQEQPTRIILNEPYDLQDGNQIFINDVEGMTQLNGKVCYIKRVTNTSLALYTNPGLTEEFSSVSYSPYTGGGIIYWGSKILANPKSINKIYRFTVGVTDGIANSQRTFTIEVASPDNLRADNGILNIDSEYLDASASYLLAPIWQTKFGSKLPRTHNLGSVRAGKNQVMQLYEYDPYPLEGPVYFDWLTSRVNPDIKLYTDNQINSAHLSTKNKKGDFALYYKDANITPVKGMKIQLDEYIAGVDSTVYTVTGVIKTSDSSGLMYLDQPLSQLLPDSRLFYVGTTSEHPLGISLDSNTGVLSGQLPVQPTYSNSYRFTVKTYKLDLSTADTTIYDATNSKNGKIVGKVYTTTSTQYVPSVLPSLSSYTGDIGDILLVKIAVPVENISTITGATYVTKVDGTTYAYVYSPTLYTVDQYSANTTGTTVTLQAGITPEAGWVLSKGSIVRTITTVTNSGGYFTVGLDASVPANDNDPAVVWTLGDNSIPCWSYVGETVASPQIYILNVLGEVPSAITWISTSSLGILNQGEVSEISVKAENTNTDYTIEYDLIQGELPPGLTLAADGTIIGKVTGTGQTYFDYTSTESSITTFDKNSTTVDRNWYFTVRASDAYRLSAIEKEFYITVYRDSLKDFTQIYVKPFLPVEKRNSYRSFVTDPTIFEPALIYRSNDPYFGIQQQIKMVIETGIEQVDLDLYASAMSQYFSRKKFFFGEIKSILAQDSAGNDVYEIIYAEIVDNLMNGTLSPTSATSVINMQLQLESIELSSSETITTNERLQPKYMTTINSDTGVPLGFVKAVPICYTLPGAAVKILSKINNAISTGKFDFKNYHFDTDRIIIENSKETGETAWVLYPTDRR